LKRRHIVASLFYTDTSGILCYMKTMIDESRAKGKSFTKEKFREYGKSVELFNGVKEWFKLINDFGHEQGLNIKHYINSSGLKEMIEGTPIADEFEKIKYDYDFELLQKKHRDTAKKKMK